MNNQGFKKYAAINLLLAYIVFAGFWSCKRTNTCKLNDRWSSKEGQDFIFIPDGKAYWLTKFGSQYDTLAFQYSLDCRKKPWAVDFKNFAAGPYAGKTLYGIIEWSSATTLRLRYEPGTLPDLRPTVSDPEQPMVLYRTK